MPENCQRRDASGCREQFAIYVELVEQREAERLAKEKTQQHADWLDAHLKALGAEPEA